MKDTTQATIESIMARARRAAKSKANTWPGLPMAQVKFFEHVALQIMIDEGTVRIVDVPNIGPSGVARKIRYVVPTGK